MGEEKNKNCLISNRKWCEDNEFDINIILQELD